MPLGFVHHDSPLYVNAKQYTDRPVRPGPTHRENIAVHAVARIMLRGYIDNIQVSWVKLGPQFAKDALRFGVNDLGGTLMNESISRASGARFGQEITATEMQSIIHQAGFQAVQRNTLYQTLGEFRSSVSIKPLVQRTLWQAQQIAALEVAE